jgi:hypothetical protein
MLAQITSEGLVSCLIETKRSIYDIESQVDFKLDITGPRAARTEIDWNSKRAGESRVCFLLGEDIPSNTSHLDDDHIETTIYTRSRLSGVSTLDTEDVEANRTSTPSTVEDGDEGHGQTIGGAVACCRKYSDGQVNCDLCLNTALKAWVVQSGPKEQEVSRRVLAVLDEAGPAGLHISTLIVSALHQFDNGKLNSRVNPDEHHGGGRQCGNCSIRVGLTDGQSYSSRRSRGSFPTADCGCTPVSGLDCYSQRRASDKCASTSMVRREGSQSARNVARCHACRYRDPRVPTGDLAGT